VFCISQNLQMYEVPERASDGKASGRCSGSPKGFRYIVLALGEEADFEALNCLPALNLIRSTKLQLSTEPAFLPNACYKPFFVLSSRYCCRALLSRFKKLVKFRDSISFISVLVSETELNFSPQRGQRL
jgi:hypothetical protein